MSSKREIKSNDKSKDELELAIEDLNVKMGEEVLISKGIKSNKN